MTRGKQTCKILKEIRRQIAEANGIEFATSECRYKGDCLGTCPKCEDEVRYLEQQLRSRRLTGKAVALAGISAASFAMLMPMTSDARTADICVLPTDSITASCLASSKVKGTVKCEYTTDGDSLATDVLTGASIRNLTNGKCRVTDINGNFEIEACVGDSIKVEYIGYESKTIRVSAITEPITVLLDETTDMLMGVVAVAYANKESLRDISFSILDLVLIDEKGSPINTSDVNVYKIYVDENGVEQSDKIYFDHNGNDATIHLYWDMYPEFRDKSGKKLQELILRIEAKGYKEPKTINVEYPKGKAAKVVRFEHKKG